MYHFFFLLPWDPIFVLYISPFIGVNLFYCSIAVTLSIDTGSKVVYAFMTSCSCACGGTGAGVLCVGYYI
jgi:hypothetical protein